MLAALDRLSVREARRMGASKSETVAGRVDREKQFEVALETYAGAQSMYIHTWHAYTYNSTCNCICICVCICTHVSCICIYMHMYMYVHICMYLYVCMNRVHEYVYECTEYICIHTQVQVCSL